MLASDFVTEATASNPNVGQLLVKSLASSDYPIIQRALLLTGVVYLVVNLGVDTLYGVVDPTMFVALHVAVISGDTLVILVLVFNLMGASPRNILEPKLRYPA